MPDSPESGPSTPPRTVGSGMSASGKRKGEHPNDIAMGNSGYPDGAMSRSHDPATAAFEHPVRAPCTSKHPELAVIEEMQQRPVLAAGSTLYAVPVRWMTSWLDYCKSHANNGSALARPGPFDLRPFLSEDYGLLPSRPEVAPRNGRGTRPAPQLRSDMSINAKVLRGIPLEAYEKFASWYPGSGPQVPILVGEFPRPVNRATPEAGWRLSTRPEFHYRVLRYCVLSNPSLAADGQIVHTISRPRFPAGSPGNDLPPRGHLPPLETLSTSLAGLDQVVVRAGLTLADLRLLFTLKLRMAPAMAECLRLAVLPRYPDLSRVTPVFVEPESPLSPALHQECGANAARRVIDVVGDKHETVFALLIGEPDQGEYGMDLPNFPTILRFGEDSSSEEIDVRQPAQGPVWAPRRKRQSHATQSDSNVSSDDAELLQSPFQRAGTSPTSTVSKPFSLEPRNGNSPSNFFSEELQRSPSPLTVGLASPFSLPPSPVG